MFPRGLWRVSFGGGIAFFAVAIIEGPQFLITIAAFMISFGAAFGWKD